MTRRDRLIRISFNDDWLYCRKPDAFQALLGRANEGWESVRLPHDAMIGRERSGVDPEAGHRGYFPADGYEYKKTFFVPDDYRDCRVTLVFEGVYRHARVYLNGDLAAQCASGYSSFSIRADHLLRYGMDNEVRIHFGAYTSASNAEVPLGMVAVMTGQVPGIDPATFVFTDIFQPRMPGMDERFETEARRLHPEAPTVLDALRRTDPSVTYVPLGRFEADPEHPLERAAVARAVADADVVVAVVGERTGWVGNNTAGEGQSTASPALPGDQEALVALLAATGRPLVTVVVSGRPLLLGPVAEASNAVLLAPLLGEEAGPAIADTLSGTVNPSGKLPSTFPRHLGQVPIYHGHHHGSGYDHPTGSRHGYNDLADSGPLYSFGHGLSYSTFDVALDDSAGAAVEEVDGLLRARLVVTNTSDVDGATVLQLYARDETATVVRPVRQLIGFTRITLAAGQRTTVQLEAPVERLFYTQIDGTRGIEAGEVTLLAGLSSNDIRASETITISAHGA